MKGRGSPTYNPHVLLTKLERLSLLIFPVPMDLAPEAESGKRKPENMPNRENPRADVSKEENGHFRT